MKTTSYILLIATSLLLLLGVMAQFSCSVNLPQLDRLHAHLRAIGLGLLGLAATAGGNYQWLRKLGFPRWLLAAAVILLVVVILPGIGTNKNGASRWLFGGQPSELAKILLVIFLADYGATNHERMREFKAGFAIPGALAGLAIGLIFLEPDWGCAALLAMLTLAMLLLAGANLGYVLAAVALGAGMFRLLLLRNPLRMARMLAFTDPEKYAQGIGWQGWHSLLALGAGGPWGSGIAEGSQKSGFIPEQPTDFVLSLIGEELGFAGTLLVLLLFVCVILCGMRIAGRIADPFGRLLALGITLLVGLQTLINIGVVTSSLPNKGIALPFVSYGGSSMVVMLGCVGLLVSIARHAPLLPLPERTQGQIAGRRGKYASLFTARHAYQKFTHQRRT